MYIITIKNDNSYYTVNSHVCLVTHLNWEHQQAGLVAYLIKLYKQLISWIYTWVYTHDSIMYRIIIMLEIKPCWLGSRIRDMEAESYILISFIGEHLDYFLFLGNRTGTVGWTEWCQNVRLLNIFGL